ncbi:MAG: nucleoside-diphosphate sugar epimerase/dehydratase [Pseudomonadota bacterium]
MYHPLTDLTRGQKRTLLLVTDASLSVPALVIALSLRAETGLTFWALAPTLLAMVAVALLGSHLLGIANTRISAYEERAVAKSLLLSALMGVAFVVAAWGIGSPVSVGLGVLCIAAHFALAITARLGMAWLLAQAYAAKHKRRRLLIYGAGMVGLQALKALRANPAFEPVGFIDDNPALHGVIIGGLRVHPPLRLTQLAVRLRAEDVLIAQSGLAVEARARLTTQLEAAGLGVTSVPAFAHLAEPSSASQIARLSNPDLQPSSTASRCYAGASVMITGAGGSIGSELSRQVLALRPRRLVLLDNSEYALYRIDAALRPVAEAAGIPLQAVLGSVGDAAQMARVLKANEAEVVLHAAAYKHVPLVEANPAAALANNALGTEVLVSACHEAGVRRFVLISSDKAVRPVSVMGASKWIAEQVVRDLAARSPGLDAAVVRFGNVLGSSGSVLPLFEAQVRRGGPVTVTDPRMERYFMSADQAVHLVLEAGAMARDGEVYLFDMGKPVQIETLARQVIHAAGYTVREPGQTEGDIELRITGVRPGEKLREELSWAHRHQATPHPRIYTAADPALSELEVAHLLRSVRHAVAEGRDIDIAALPIKRLFPAHSAPSPGHRSGRTG